jgi:small conductance mechanosensitive channel
MINRIAISVIASLLLTGTAITQDAPAYKATTASDSAVEADVLKLMLRPLTASEVEAEAEAWLLVLAAQNKEISQNQIQSRQATTGQDSTASTALAQMRTAQTRIVDRLNITLGALKERGGDPKRFNQYIDASTQVDLDATDVSATFTFISSWITSPEGGIRLGLNILKFLITLLAFKIIAGIVAGVVRKAVSKLKGTSDLLRDFMINVVRRVTFFIGLIVALSMLEVDITPFVAALGAAGFVIGFALQGTLSNFASGIMILIYRPYDIGEVVTAAGTTGKVDAMTLVSTTLRLPDNQTVIVPNNSIWGDVITNVTGQSTRRVDMVFGCGYGDDLKKTQELLEDIVKNHSKVHAEPAPVIKLHELADSSVNFVVRPWANTSDYWDVFWDVTRSVKERFDAEGLNIPFPQQEVHMHQLKD